MTVVVGWVDGGNVRGEWADSLSRLCAYETHRGRLVTTKRVHWGPQLEEARNLLVERFLDTPAEWLFSTDTDMTFDHDSVERLLATADPTDAPLVGGLCFGVNAEFGQFPAMYRLIDGMPHVLFDEADGAIHHVDATGGAFTLTHRTVFEKYERAGPHRWFHRREVPPTSLHPGGILGEDLSWCVWLRECGVPIVVDTSVVAGHVKPSTVSVRSYEMMRHASD